MAFNITSARSAESVFPEADSQPIITALLDSAEDLDALGTNWHPGSMAMVAASGGAVYLLSPSKEWEEQ